MRKALTLALLGAAPACGGLSGDWQYDGAYDFARLRTYDWIGIRAAPTERVERQFEQEADAALHGKGFARAAGNPDFRVVAYFDITRRAATTETSSALPRGGLMPGADIPASWLGDGGAASSFAAREGSVMLDLIDPRTKQLLWRGTVSGAFSARMDDDQRSAAVKQAVAILLSRFPP